LHLAAVAPVAHNCAHQEREAAGGQVPRVDGDSAAMGDSRRLGPTRGGSRSRSVCCGAAAARPGGWSTWRESWSRT
jgi:hypothetical protein